MPLIVSFDQNMASSNGKSYRFVTGFFSCESCALTSDGFCPDDPELNRCGRPYRKDGLYGVWKLEKTHSFSAPSFRKKK